MKKIFLFVALITVNFAFTQSINNLIKFAKEKHSFGNIKQNKAVTVNFTFTNPGTKPLIIEKAEAECGCTSPEYPKQPIMPGKTGTIKVTYDAKTMGDFTKKVTITLVNVKEPKIVVITGKVV